MPDSGPLFGARLIRADPSGTASEGHPERDLRNLQGHAEVVASDWSVARAKLKRVAAQTRLLELLLDLFGRLGREAPLVLVFEDLHWADRASRSGRRGCAVRTVAPDQNP